MVRPHDLEDPHERRGLPVALATEAVALGHETLHGDTGELPQSAEVFEVRREGGELAAFEKRPQTSLDTGRVVQRVVTGTALGELGHDRVAGLVVASDRVNSRGRGGLHFGDEVVHSVGVHGDPEPELRLDLVAFCHRNIAHVVTEADEPELLCRVPAGRGACP